MRTRKENLKKQRNGIVRIRAGINKTEKNKSIEKINETKAVSLKRSTKCITL